MIGITTYHLGDRWYACTPFLARVADVSACSLLRVKSNRVFYRPAPARVAGQIGASRKDGDRFQCQDESSHGERDETWEGTDAKGATGDANPFAAVENACSTATTAWKSAGTGQRLSSQAQNTSSGYL
jgi:hypothetical protein